jgi:hypothetical protein
MFAASEDAYERATQEGYAENPAVIAAVAALKSAWTALRVANFNLMTAKGFFRVAFAGWRAARVHWKTREASINVQATIEQAAAENRLYNRCLILSSRPAT